MRRVVAPSPSGNGAGQEPALPYAEEGVAVNSSSGALNIDGLTTAEAKAKVGSCIHLFAQDILEEVLCNGG